MKQWIAIILVIVCLCNLTACSQNLDPTAPGTTQETTEPKQAEGNNPTETEDEASTEPPATEPPAMESPSIGGTTYACIFNIPGNSQPY